MKRSSFANFDCALAQALERVGDWWTPLIIRDLYLGVSRFDELIADLGLSRNLLTARLRALVANGIVVHDRPARGPAHYRLTQAGLDLVPILVALTQWGDRWVNLPGGPTIRFQHKDCGALSQVRVSCDHCDGTIAADNIVPVAGAGRHDGKGIGEVVKRLAARHQ